MYLIKQWEINSAHDYEKTLKRKKKYFYLGNRDICKTKQQDIHTAHDCKVSYKYALDLKLNS